MRPKLNKILLIDDSDADNFIHQRVIRKADVAQNIIVRNNGQDALDYLTAEDENGNYPVPELIFLDINMPAMNGWEFLEHYDKLEPEKKAGIIVCMLTTSVAEADKQKAGELPMVEIFLHKPLTQEVLATIMDEYFLGKE